MRLDVDIEDERNHRFHPRLNGVDLYDAFAADDEEGWVERCPKFWLGNYTRERIYGKVDFVRD